MSMKLLDEYFELQKRVHEYFGYVQDWNVIPLDDATDQFWAVDAHTVFFAATESELEKQDGQYYEMPIYTQRHLPKWVYEGEDFTMICVDTQTDGNKLISVFDNAKKRLVPSEGID